MVVEGGLNDFDQRSADITAGFVRLMRALEGERVVVVGPVLAPARSNAVPRVDRLLAGLADEHGAAYVRTTGLHLDYLDDRLHLTEAGHRELGEYVAAALPLDPDPAPGPPDRERHPGRRLDVHEQGVPVGLNVEPANSSLERSAPVLLASRFSGDVEELPMPGQAADEVVAGRGPRRPRASRAWTW